MVDHGTSRQEHSDGPRSISMRAPWRSTGPCGPRATPRPAPQAAGRRTPPGGRAMAGPRPDLLPRERTPLDRWQVRREFAVITRAAALGDQWTPREGTALVRVHPQRQWRPHRGHQRPDRSRRTTVTESVYWHEIRPAHTTRATAMNKIHSKKRPDRPSASPTVTSEHQPRVTPRLAPS